MLAMKNRHTPTKLLKGNILKIKLCVSVYDVCIILIVIQILKKKY